MAFSGAYDEATINNPSSALTDFSFIIDLSNMSSDWWDAVNTTDGTRGRASKGDGLTELACDWIDFDSTAETGLLRVLWSGSLASTGTQSIRIYPPTTDNSSYARTATYGQDNAYRDEIIGYYPDGGGTDRTINEMDGTETGISSGDVSGQLGQATNYGETADHVDFGEFTGFNSTNWFISAWVRPEEPSTYTDSWMIQCYGDNGYEFVLGDESNGDGHAIVDSDWSWHRLDKGTYSADTWNWFGLSFGSTARSYLNGVQQDSTATNGTPMPSTTEHLLINGNSGRPALGYYQHIMLLTEQPSIDWVGYEYDQVDDNSTFWGTWTWTGTATAYNIEADSGSFTFSGQDASLLRNTNLSCDSGSYTITGQDTDLLKMSVIQADTGAYVLTSQDADILKNSIIDGEPGIYAITGQDCSLRIFHRVEAETSSYVLTGQDATLTYLTGHTLIAEQGVFSLSGEDVSTLCNRVIQADNGEFILTGEAVDLNILTGYSISADHGEFTLSGADIDCLRSYILGLDSGTYLLTGQSASLSYSGAVIISPDKIQVPGTIQQKLDTNGIILKSISANGEITSSFNIMGEIA